MLQAINDRIKGWLGIAIVVLIGLPFALWGVSSYFDDAGPRYAAKVNNIEITANEFERTVSIKRQALLREYNGELPIKEKELREKLLQQLINQRLLESVSFDAGYRISDSVLALQIKQQFTVEGVFDRVRFESYVASIGMSVPGYENSLRSELRMQQMQSAIVSSAFVTAEETRNLAVLSEQTRDISVITFNVDHFSTAKKSSEEEIKQYYDNNLQRFMVPEKIKVDYVEITSESLAGSLEIDEAQIKQMYDDYVISIGTREERKASHILVLTNEDKVAAAAKIDSIKLELEQGAEFSELAKEYSQDTASAEDGGDLGWITSGEMVKPFEDALYDLSEGSVSEIVESKFGFHLIKLNGVRGETVEPLGVKRYEFEEELRNDGIASLFYDLSERLASTAYENPDSLDFVVEDLGLKVQSSDYFSRAAGKGVAAEEKVRSIAFTSLVLEQGSNSDIIEISPTHVVVLRLNEHVPAIAIPVNVVSSKIENILKVKNGHKQTKAVAAEAKAKIEAGESVASLEAEGVTVNVLSAVSRGDSSKVDPTVLNNAFQLAPAMEGNISIRQVDLITGDVALIVLTGINASENITQDRLNLIKSDVVRENAIRDFTSALQFMKDSADIDKNIRVIDR